MAIHYVWSGATGVGTGADFANAFTTIDAAIAAGAAGDSYYLAHDHSELPALGADRTITFNGTHSVPDFVIAIDRTTQVPVGSASALLGVAGNFGLKIAGVIFTDGIKWQAGDGAGSANGKKITFSGLGNTQVHKNGEAILSATTNSNLWTDQNMQVDLDNFQINANGGNCWIVGNANTMLTWQNSKPWKNTTPAYILVNAPSTALVLFDNCDLSNVGAGASTFQALVSYRHNLVFRACKMASAITKTVPVMRGEYVQMINCSDENGKAINSRYSIEGTTSMERVIVRTGGASDGIDGFSLKMAATANAGRYFPLVGPEIKLDIAPADIGVAKTVTLHIVSDGVTFTNAELWAEVAYLDTAGSYDAAFTSDGPANSLSVGSNQSTEAGSWTTTGLTSPVFQTLDVTFTPNQAGPLRIVPKLGKASVTAYVCPKMEIA